MAARNNQKTNSQNRLSMVSSIYEKSQVTSQLLETLRVARSPQGYAPMVVNITKAMLQPNTDGEGCFDIELQGTVPQISSGLAYLESLNLRIVGKPNADGDSWCY
ncbi:hypothetical protein [Nostoc sp.]|uniref:hypothetical protein n=1 Tax=Nostoc sp. TaxID=1180 RepID=UPI002FF15384